MISFGRTYRLLKTEVSDPAKVDAALRDIGLLQRDSAIAKAGVPGVVNALAGEEKTKKLAAYRVQMIGMMRTLLDLEEAVMNQKADDIKKCMAKLDEEEKGGHKDFLPAE